MDKLKQEKLDAIDGIETELNPKYEIEKDKLHTMNSNMSNISNKDKVKKIDGIVTKERTDEDYNLIWNYFYDYYRQSFESYMGYGVNEIQKIGVNKFIDYIDWRCTEDVDNYKNDRIKVIPCVHCKSEFTTFQMDLGLCEKCKDKYKLEKFDDMCAASEEKDPGSSAGLVMLFTYFEDFRNMFNKEISFEERALLCATEDDLAGIFTRDFLLDYIGSSDSEDFFMSVIENNIDKLNDFAKRRYESIKNILISEDSDEKKIERIKLIF